MLTDEIRIALEQAKEALEYSNHCLDGVTASEDEDEGEDGGSATCQACVKINKRALRSISRALDKGRGE